MLPHVFGVGFGTVLLCAIWAVCLFACLSACRKAGGGQSGIVYLLLASTTTAVLLAWPRDKCRNGDATKAYGNPGQTLATSEQAEWSSNGSHEDSTAKPDPTIIENDDSIKTNATGGEIDVAALPRLALIVFLIGLLIFCSFRQLRDTMFSRAPLPPVMGSKLRS